MENDPNKKKRKVPPRVTPLLLNIKAMAVALSPSPATLYRMSSAGELGPMPIKFGKRRLWRYEELAAWVRAGCPRRELWVKMAQEQGFGHQFGRKF